MLRATRKTVSSAMASAAPAMPSPGSTSSAAVDSSVTQTTNAMAGRERGGKPNAPTVRSAPARSRSLVTPAVAKTTANTTRTTLTTAVIASVSALQVTRRVVVGEGCLALRREAPQVQRPVEFTLTARLANSEVLQAA